MPKTVAPSLGLDSYSCPHCGALAHQSWFKVGIALFDRGQKPDLLDPADIDIAKIKKIEDPRERKQAEDLAVRLSKNILTNAAVNYGLNCPNEMVNLAHARCHSCGGFTIWVNGLLNYPSSDIAFIPSDDMPPDVKKDFEEAAAIYQTSPRGAAALLRLALQRLMPHVGQKGKDLNGDIGKLVQTGLDPVIQQALDVVRVVGNNAVHPGQIDIDDNQEVAARLFDLVNIIVTMMITTKKKIGEMFEQLPPSAKAQIERRDTPLTPPSPLPK